MQKTDWILKVSQNALQGWEASQKIYWGITKNNEKSRSNPKIYVSAINLGATSKKTENKSNTYKNLYSNKKQKNNKGDTI